jgi:hypothetical protein
MPLELEAPADTNQPPVRLFAEPPAAAEAATLLDGEAAETEPQREGSEQLTIRLAKDVTDDQAGFAGKAGETYDAYADAEGNVWLPLATNDIMLEAEEFEIVEPLADQAEPTHEAATSQEIAKLVDAVAGEIRKETLAATVDATPPTPGVPAVAPPAVPKPPADDYTARRRDYLRQKDILQEQIAALMIEQAKLKEQVKRAKKEAEVYVEQLNELIDDWEHPAPLENEQPTAASTAAAGPSSLDAGGCGEPPASDDHADQPAAMVTQAEPAGAPEPQPSISQSSKSLERSYESELRAAGLDELKLPGSLHEKLTDAGVNSVWDLERLRGEISQGKEKWPKGIGAAKITTIEGAVLSWLTRNQSRWEKPAAVEAPEANPASQSEQVKNFDADLDDL